MASSPKAAKHGVIFFFGRAASSACVLAGGLLCCAVVALKAVEAPASTGQLFALVPRPAHLEALQKPDLDASGAVTPTLWRLVPVPARHPPEQMQAALEPLEHLLGIGAAQELEGEAAAQRQLPVGGVGVARLESIEVAWSTCLALVGYQGTKKHRVGQISAALLTEWHVAILWANRLAICGVEPVGLFRFATTLRQMMDQRLRPDNSTGIGGLFQALPPFLLEDWPQYTWRGLQLDCVRHFMPLGFIKRYLSAMAYYKANAFHWHLTDDQAWRLHIPSRPKLVGANGWSPEFYSGEDVREIVDFAARLFITVLPTIETPGHCLAALAAYPELACEGEHFEVPKTRVGTYDDIMCVGKLSLAEFAKDVFAEVARLFPGPLVHVGGDEVLTTKWQNSEHAKAFAGMVGLKNLGPDLMEAWYCFLSQLLAEHGKRIVMWDDHFKQRVWRVTRLCPDAESTWVVQAWKLDDPVGGPGQSTVSESWPFQTIASPMKHVYLDYPVASIDYGKTLEWKLGGTPDTTLGGCANMWTEDSEPKDVGAKVYPRYLGIAERLWNEGGRHRPRPADARPLDASSHTAAKRHCEEGGPLAKDFGFACGKFQRTINSRSKTWLGARVTNTIDLYAEAFSPERALDDDEESYFWGIAPKQGDHFEVTFMGTNRQSALGKWFRRVTASTGAKDRPGDRLEKGKLQVVQWLPVGVPDEGSADPLPGPEEESTSKAAANLPQYKLTARTLAHFLDGIAVAEGHELAEGPVVSVRIVCEEFQTKWMALTEITAEEGQPLEHPTLQDLPAPNPPRSQHRGPRGRHGQHPSGSGHRPKHGPSFHT